MIPRVTPLMWLQMLLCGALLGLFAAALRAEPAERIVSLGGSVTEIVYALGEESRLIARDTTSNYPEAARALPDVGYLRALSPEGVLSVNPSLILTEEGAGPPEAMALLREAAIPVIEVPDGFDGAAVLAKIRAVADTLGVPEKGAALAADVSAQLAEAQAGLGKAPPRRVLFILSMQGGRIMAAGQDTAAEGILHLAGAQNALTGFSGYKPVTDEAILAADPQVILMMDRSGDLAITDAMLRASPALSSTTAGQTGAFVRMEGMALLGFGPRLPQTVRALAAALARTAG
jgi:iron complex transport system substrate-binding protein